MTEYIEKNKAIKELYEVYDYEFPTASGGFDEYARMIVPNTIKNMPAADVAPVVHGRWIHKGNSQVWECSRCGRGINNNPEGIDLYCYHCGAQMDEKEDNHETN